MACAAISPGSSLTPSPTASPTSTAQPAPTPTPTPSPTPGPDAAFYLRAWYSQALPPRETFTWLPMQTVAEGILLDGNVAVPAIYPGPLMISPTARPISEAGNATIVEEARRFGLLEGETDFTGGVVMPGSRTAHLDMTVDGTSYSLTGVPDLDVVCNESMECEAEPGTPAAFTAFWRELENAQLWLEPELGPVGSYEPARVALLLTQPPVVEPGVDLSPEPWPYETPIAEAGVEFPGGAGERCITLEGAALDVVLPTLQSGTQLTVFVDDNGTQAAPIVRVLVPDEPSPCPDGDAS